MPLRPGQTFYVEFTTRSVTTGARANADTTPTALVNHNGVDDDTVSVTVSGIAAGRYVATGVVPTSYAAGDAMDVVVTATVGGVIDSAIAASYTIDPRTPVGSVVVTQDSNGTGSLTVENNAGQPILGATVTAYLASAYASSPTTAIAYDQATTDINGHWTLYLPAGQTWTLVFQSTGDLAATASLST